MIYLDLTLQFVARQGFRLSRSDILFGRTVPGTCGPQIASGSETGMGGDPELRQMKEP